MLFQKLYLKLISDFLQKINPLQEIIIKTEHFDSVLLGSNTDRLIDQINKLNQLQNSLPNLLINTKVKIVDLKDPIKPELKIEKTLNDIQ
jgi:cell division protein FtsQ